MRIVVSTIIALTVGAGPVVAVPAPTGPPATVVTADVSGTDQYFRKIICLVVKSRC